MATAKAHVEVGILEDISNSEPWLLESRFFPSKVGGKPAWLDLKNISLDLSCGVCSKPCIFLCQVHAPLENVYCFLRTIFVFVCINPECCTTNSNINFKVFRCQLPKINDYYVPEYPNEKPDWHPESTVERFSETCDVCGCLGLYRCGKCKIIKYCSKEHQILDWKSGHNEVCCTDNIRKRKPNILFPEYEICIEPEFVDSEHEKMSEKMNTEKDDDKLGKDQLELYEKLLKSGKGGSLQNIPADILESYALSKEDKYMKNYKLRLQLCKDQVIRYDRGGEPLYAAKPTISIENIPSCDICNGPRQFEFQILSTLLNHLNVDSVDKSLDWGNLFIFTCKNNCNEGPPYKAEFLWKQDII